MEEIKNVEDVFTLGTWLGRKQALGLIAGRCTAAEIECLIEVHDNKLYQTLEPTWEDYCRKRLGISRRTAERLMRSYRQQGPQLARLTCFTRISPREYRLFSPLVTEDGLLCEGEVIPLESVNAVRLSEAVEAIRGRAAAELPPSDPAAHAFARAERSLATALAEFSRLLAMDLDDSGQQRLWLAVEQGRERLAQLHPKPETPASA